MIESATRLRDLADQSKCSTFVKANTSKTKDWVISRKESTLSKKMKIGILIAEFNTLQNFELRIIEQIIADPSLELSLLIKDGRKRSDIQLGLWAKIKRFVTFDNFVALLFLKIQLRVESKIFKSKTTVNRDEIIAYLKQVPFVELNPTSKGYFDIFGKEDAEKVLVYGLDIILRHEFRIIRGDILTAAKHGIWSFHHGDNSINRGGPPCFWENVLKQPVVGVTLQQLTPELDGGFIIDKGYYDRHWSYLKSNNDIYENSVTLLFKNIRRLQLNKLALTKSTIYWNPLYKNPTLFYVSKYILSFYTKIFSIIFNRILQLCFGVREDCWTLFIGKGCFMETSLFRLKPIKLPKNKFWADPFLFKHNDELFIFFENFDYKLKKGTISCGKIIDKAIVDVKDVLDLPYHLSYPFIFEEDGDIFLIPECSAARRVDVYKCIEFPLRWKIHATAFEGEEIVDTSYFRDDNGQRWLFLNKGFSNLNSELYIYRIDSLGLNKIESHASNPTIIDTRVARNAGPIFKHNGYYYRPSQNNINDIYGYGLNINKIKSLDIDDYDEEKIVTIKPNFKKGLSATHHVHQLDNMFVIDGCYKRKR